MLVIIIVAVVGGVVGSRKNNNSSSSDDNSSGFEASVTASTSANSKQVTAGHGGTTIATSPQAQSFGSPNASPTPLPIPSSPAQEQS